MAYLYLKETVHDETMPGFGVYVEIVLQFFSPLESTYCTWLCLCSGMLKCISLFIKFGSNMEIRRRI